MSTLGSHIEAARSPVKVSFGPEAEVARLHSDSGFALPLDQPLRRVIVIELGAVLRVVHLSANSGHIFPME